MSNNAIIEKTYHMSENNLQHTTTTEEPFCGFYMISFI